MILVIAEKPSVARDISRVLKCARREGYFESETHRVAWALGHLVTHKDPGELDEKYQKWRMEDLPILPEKLETKIIPRTRQQFSLLKKLMLDPSTARLVCATDAGREGELIFRFIYETAGCDKPVDRLWISSLTDGAIREGFESLKPSAQYDGLYQSALCRSQADWLFGMNASRAFTLKYDALLSVGRVQTPTLAILTQRAKEIRDFTPLTYHTLTADFGDYSGLWFDPKTEEKAAHRIPDRAQAEAIAREVKGQNAKVTQAQTQPKKELPPQLFDLTSLQREANRILGFTAAKTLRIAQSLYEARKCLTYPRTDSRFLPHDMIPRVNKALESLPDSYQQLVAGIPRRDGRLPYSRRIFDDAKVSDHHAIIPTSQKAETDRFTAEERALFDLVARRTISAFYPAYEYDLTTVITQSQGHSFKSMGRTVRIEGWKAVTAGGEKGMETAEEPALPTLKAGDERTVKSVKIKQETTKPPPQHTDASLLARMEHPGVQLDDEELQEALQKNGLGTPATRAAIIERVVEVGYAQRRGKTISATEKGEILIRVVPEDIASPVMTGKWEQALEEIAKGSRDPGRFMEGIRRLAAHLVQYAKSQTAQVEFPRESRKAGGRSRQAPAAKELEGLSCPLCGGRVLESEKAFGCAEWKGGCRFTLWKNALLRVKGPMLNEAIVRLLLRDGKARGSSGTVLLDRGEMSFVPAGADQPSLSIPVSYVRKEKNDSQAAKPGPQRPASKRRKPGHA